MLWVAAARYLFVPYPIVRWFLVPTQVMMSPVLTLGSTFHSPSSVSTVMKYAV